MVHGCFPLEIWEMDISSMIQELFDACRAGMKAAACIMKSCIAIYIRSIHYTFPIQQQLDDRKMIPTTCVHERGGVIAARGSTFDFQQELGNVTMSILTSLMKSCPSVRICRMNIERAIVEEFLHILDGSISGSLCAILNSQSTLERIHALIRRRKSCHHGHLLRLGENPPKDELRRARLVFYTQGPYYTGTSGFSKLFY